MPKPLGRPHGATSKLVRQSREIAQMTGLLPHEILLNIARGAPIQVAKKDGTGAIMWEREGVPIFTFIAPDFQDIMEAAKAAAPYYAPKISTVEVIQGVPDNELDLIIAQLAAQAGIDLGSVGESEADEEEASTDRSPGTRVRLIDPD